MHTNKYLRKSIEKHDFLTILLSSGEFNSLEIEATKLTDDLKFSLGRSTPTDTDSAISCDAEAEYEF